MLVKTIAGQKAAGQQLSLGGGLVTSTRFLTQGDGLGFTLSDVRCATGMRQTLWYKHHWEANYIVQGQGSVEDLDTGKRWSFEPGMVYTVGPRDRHRVCTESDCHLVSIFNPPLTGGESHDADGAYAPSGEIPEGQNKMFVKTVAEYRASGKEKVVAGGSARTVRLLLQEDRLGFALCDVNLAAGNHNVLWYKHHWEANYILEGRGEVSNLTTGEAWSMEPGMMYIVGPKDRHRMHAHTDLHLLSVFNPPIVGDEVHDEEGTLPGSGPLPPGLPGD